jgi:hypothetical protein
MIVAATRIFSQRMLGQRWQKVARVEEEYLALLQRNGISRTFLAIERRYLAENFAFSDIV